MLAENKRLFIRNQVYPELKIEQDWRVESDDKWLSFVLNQLLTNAVRYSAGKSNKVTIRAYERGSHLVLEVQDYGIGIPAEDIQRVFKPYFTGKTAASIRSRPGWGFIWSRKFAGGCTMAWKWNRKWERARQSASSCLQWCQPYKNVRMMKVNSIAGKRASSYSG